MGKADMQSLLEHEGTEVVELCNGTIADGRAFHAFIQMTIAEHRRYHRDLRDGRVMDLPSYGVILHSGWGGQPDAQTRDHMMKAHTDNFKLLERIAEIASAQQAIVYRNSKERSEA